MAKITQWSADNRKVVRTWTGSALQVGNIYNIWSAQLPTCKCVVQFFC